jgi:endonuclease/exonuclease/phosphatase family metal-dependent hydrolase
MWKCVARITSAVLGAGLLAGCALIEHGAAAPGDQAFSVATYNLRYDNPQDGVNAWPLRREAVKALIRFHAFDVFGTQEGLIDQIRDLAAMDEFSFVGVGRDDGKRAGEHSAIFYRKDRFSLQQHGDFWLSQTPGRPSLGWDAECCKRIASWAQLRDVRSGKSFYVFSAHFDHQGIVARRESAKLMLSKIRDIAGSHPVICLGDFNSTPETEPIATLRGALRDARLISAAPAYGPTATFNDFKWNVAPTARIDYIFVSPQFKVMTYAVLSDSINQRYPSDHFPVLARVAVE